MKWTLLCCLSLLLACARDRGAIPHQNFKNILQGTVGRTVEDENLPFRFAYSKDLKNSVQLPSGIIENHYLYEQYPGDFCAYILEIDPKTNRIVAARIEGDPAPCYIVP